MYYLAIRKENSAICNNVERTPGIMLSGVSHLERQIRYNFSYMWNLKIN